MSSSSIKLRAMESGDWEEVAELIHLSTNFWYQSHGMPAIFSGEPASATLFCEVYESLDPGCCALATTKHGRIVGSCFYHPRPTHVSLGIMNVHPNYFSAGIASRLLEFIVEFARNEKLPVRLVSSAMNLDSFSLYTRMGFVPRQSFQDMFLAVPDSGISFDVEERERIRPATLADTPSMAALEQELNHISREKDFRFFIENEAGIWNTSVFENASGDLDGFLISVQHPASNMIGPGISRTDQQALALLQNQLNHNRGRTPVFLIPVDRPHLVQTLYSWGARNCEIHFAQVLGDFSAPTGVVMPTFMPETG